MDEGATKETASGLPPPAKRDVLLDTAASLFYCEGIHATGIDKILKEAGVARMTLYHHFKAKDDLILAALRRVSERWVGWFVATVETRASTPAQRLLAIFDTLEDWFECRSGFESLGLGPRFLGCPFIHAAGEYADPDHPVHALATEHKQTLRSHIQRWTGAAGASNPDLLATQLSMLVEGAIALRHVSGEASAASMARRTAEKLLFS